MRYFFAILLSTILLAACNTAPAKQNNAATAPSNQANTATNQQTSLDPTVVEFLLTSAAKDFHDHKPPEPAQFRNVRIGHSATSDGKVQYTMCGEFLPKSGNGEWLSFATIKTSGYEQYIGKGALAYCQNLTWDNVGDQSAALQSKLDAPR